MFLIWRRSYGYYLKDISFSTYEAAEEYRKALAFPEFYETQYVDTSGRT